MQFEETTPKLLVESETVTENLETESAPAEKKPVEIKKQTSSLLVLNDDAMSSCNNS